MASISYSFTCHCSLKSCSKCLWISHCLHYELYHWDYSFEVSMCTSKCLLQTFNFIVCARHLWLSTAGLGDRTEGSGLHPLWSEGVRRIGCVVCCVETWGVRHGPGILFSGTPLFSGLSARHRCSTALPRAVLARVDRCTAAPLR